VKTQGTMTAILTQNFPNLDRLPGIFYLINKKGIIFRYNDAFIKFFKLEPKNVKKELAYNDIPLLQSYPKMLEKIQSFDNEAFKKGEQAIFSKIENPIMPEESIISYRIKYYNDIHQDYLFIHMFNTKQPVIGDLTTQESFTALDNIVATMPGHLYWKDTKGIYRGCNDRQAKSLGLRYGHEVIGKSDLELPWPDEDAKKFQENDRKIMKSGKSKVFEEYALVDGKKAIVLSHKSPLLDHNGNIKGILGISLDITKLKETEKNLEIKKLEAERANQLKTEFIRNMEHDIRTPFVGVYGMINLLAERETDSEKKSILSDVSLCAKELLDYCDSILDFSKIEAQSFPVVAKTFNLKKLVDSVMTIESIAAKHKKLNFSLNYDNELPPVVIGDPYRLKRILINLISNAIKFTKEGFVRLSVSVSRQIPETRNLIVNFSVSDSGIGIPKDKKELIYERFTRVVPSNKGLYKGQGLGLRIVKQFVDELDGDIHLKSEVGEGSTFTIFLALKIPLSDEIIDEE
jgi:two-component system, OmpR family, aerobic respiration control sensor histidine kinase ArcB